jgi:hypothetical protein
MDVEYIVGQRLFAALPGSVKALWHRHGYEVASGEIAAPRIPATAEHAVKER